MGPKALQGPHQGAQKSMSTGLVVDDTTFSKLSLLILINSLMCKNYDLRKISTAKATAPPKTSKSRSKKRILGFDLALGPSLELAFLDFFLPLVGGEGILSASFAGIGAGSIGSGTGACMAGGAGVGLGGGGAVGERSEGEGGGAAGTALGGAIGATGGGDPGPANGEVVTLSLGPPGVAPTEGAPGTLSFKLGVGGVGCPGWVIAKKSSG